MRLNFYFRGRLLDAVDVDDGALARDADARVAVRLPASLTRRDIDAYDVSVRDPSGVRYRFCADPDAPAASAGAAAAAADGAAFAAPRAGDPHVITGRVRRRVPARVMDEARA